jgi:hypothetical protein
LKPLKPEEVMIIGILLLCAIFLCIACVGAVYSTESSTTSASFVIGDATILNHLPQLSQNHSSFGVNETPKLNLSTTE